MEFAVWLRLRWRRIFKGRGWSSEALPVWGAEPPTILGLCSQCGAVVLEGWHQEIPEGLLCRRCAGKD